MTIEDFLAGHGETPAESAKREQRQQWQEYIFSEEYADEVGELIDLDCYDGQIGEA